jgi:hypothetical protein
MRFSSEFGVYLLHLFVAFLFFFPFECFAQTLGGKAAYNFLKLPSSPLLTSIGGVNVSYNAGEVSLSANNPALLQANINKQLNVSFNAFLAGTKAYSLTGALHSEKMKTFFGGSVFFLDYGSLPTADATGNMMGQFRPVDFVVQASAAKHYLENWTYGVTVKLISSSYGQYRSSALAADVGVLFHDSASNFSASFVVMNMGAQLKTYAGEAEDLPFDLQAGITKRLAKAPFGFSLTARHLQAFDILYNDTVFNQSNNIASSSSTLAKLLTHIVLASHFYIGQNIEANIGYNFLQRQQLSIGTEGNGLTGFSAGLRIRFPKLQVLYARSAYQRGVASNQIGLTVHIDRLFGLGH